MPPFAIGERALLVPYKPATATQFTANAIRVAAYEGTIVTVLAYRQFPKNPDALYCEDFGYDIETHDGNTIDVGEGCLQKLPPAKEKTLDWERCVWQPTMENA